MKETLTIILANGGLILTIIILLLKYVRKQTKFETETRMKLIELEKNIKDNKHDFHEHEKMNEIQFEKYHSEVKDLSITVVDNNKTLDKKITDIYKMLFDFINKK